MRLLRPLRASLTYASLVLILSTCDMANVLSTPKQRKVVLSLQSDSTLVQASSTKPAVQVTIDGAPMLDPQVRLVSSDTTVIAISAGGDSLIARKLGRAIITASLEGTLLPTPLPFASDTIYVVPKEFTLDRATATLTAIGDTIRLVATAIDAANRAIPDPGVVWMSSDTSRATVSATGLVTARSNTSTPVTITARLDGISAVAQVTVAQQIARFTFEPSTITFDALGAQSVVAVSARDRNGNAIPTLPTIAWTSGNAAIVSVHPTNGTLISLNSGSTFIRASATNGSTTVSDTVHVEVNQQATRIIISAVAGVTIGAIGGKLQLTARAYDRLNAEMKKPISWASLDGNFAGVDENGVVTGRGVGTARIVARVDTASAVQTITVTDNPVRLSLNPSSATLTSVRDSLFISLTAFNAVDIPISSPAVTWRSTDSTIVKVLAPGLVRAERAGTANIIVSSGTLSVSAAINVTNAPAFLDIALSAATLASIGDSLVPAISLRNARGDELDRTSVTWSTDLSRIADVSVTGVIYALDSGTTKVRASSGSLRDSILITVTNAPASITLNRSADEMTALGQTLGYSGLVRNAAGNEIPGFRVTWRSSDPAIVSISSSGVATALGEGTVQITGQAGAVSASASLVVRNVPSSVSVAPKTASITSVGDALQFTATVRNALGAIVPGATVGWSTPDGSIATLSATGLLTSTGVGTARVIAASGGKADTATVTINNSPDQVNIVPGEATLASINDSLVPELVVTNARGVALGASSLLWSSDDALVARVTATGTIIATGSGATYIKAVSPTNSTRRDSILITVTNAPATVVLNDNRDTLTALGRTRTYTATVRNARGARIADAILDWQSSVPSVASVVDGTATAQGVGTTIITARSGAASASLDLTVTNNAVSLDLQPPALSITSINDTVRLSVTARNDLGNLIPSGQVSWSSTVTTVATVDANGNVASIDIGTARIIATSGSLADTTIVTVTNNPATIAIAPDTVRLTSLGDSIAPPATLTNSRGVALPRTAATWSSDDPTIARVSASGVITARDTGTTIVRATSGLASDAVVVVVTNAPAMLTFSTARDTLTAAGQTVSYSVAVTNTAGNAIDDPAVAYMSTNTGVATISGSGTGAIVTVTGFGTTLLIARSGAVADTIVLVVVNPTVIYVDNSVFANPRTGTSSRPYAKIQDGVNAADPFDTVFVRKGNAAYSETVSLAKRIVLLGDSTFFSRSSPNPSVLPLISHDTGSAAITAITTSPEIIRFFRIRHTVDGLAVDARGSDIRLAHLFINTDETSVSGGGISVDNAAVSNRPALIDSVSVNAVAGFGIRFNGVVNGTVRAARISLVDSVAGFSGAGVEITGGRNNLVELSTIRRSGSGVHIDAAQGVTLRENVFIDAIAGVMDGVRITGSRGTGALSSSSFGANLVRNRFTGGRYSVRSSSSSWLSEGMSSTGAVQGIVGENNDVISMFGDTISSTTSGCVDVTGNGSAVTIRGGTFQFCAGGASTTMQVAVRATGSTILSVDSSVFRGPNTTAIEHGSLGVSGALTVSRNTIVPSGTRTLPLGTRSAIIEARGTGQASIHRNVITDFTGLTGMVLASGVSADVDSNLVTRNGVAARVLAGATMAAVSNDWYANDTAAVVSQSVLDIPGNFWGDSAGPRRAVKLRAAGDSAAGPVTYDAVAPAPLYLGTGAASAMRLIWGDSGTFSKLVPLAKPFIVRIVDAQGRPLAGVSVQFRSSTSQTRWVGGTSTLDVTTGADGLARGTFDPNNRSGTHTITISVPASPALGSIPITINSA